MSAQITFSEINAKMCIWLEIINLFFAFISEKVILVLNVLMPKNILTNTAASKTSVRQSILAIRSCEIR